jgi:hypothetical protein
MQHGKLSVVQIERQLPDGYTKVLLVEVALGKDDVITISEQDGVPLSAPIREQTERLIELILAQQERKQ